MSNNLIVFDIETAPLPATHINAMMPVFEAPANYKDEAKILAYKAAMEQVWRDKAALSPLTGQIIAIGYMSAQDNVPVILLEGEPVYGMDNRDERNLIQTFWQYYLLNYDKFHFVGHNILRFDLPFLIRRSWKLGINVPAGIFRGRYFNDGFIDTMDMYALGGREDRDRISLDSLAKWLGVGMKNGSGADFAKLEPEQKRVYLENDLRLTMECYKRMAI